MRMKWILVGLGVIGLSIGLGSQWQASGSSRLLPFQGRLTDANGQVISDGSRVVQFKLYNAPVSGQSVWNGEVQNLTVNGGMVSTLLGSKASLAGVDFNQNLYLEMTLDANGDAQITLADPPLLPRQAVLPSVFAIEAANSRKLAGHDWSALFGTNSPEDGSLLDSKIREGSVGNSKLANGAVDSRTIAASGIVASNLAEEVVTLQKLSKEVASMLVPAGTIVSYGGVTVPSGWLLCDGAELRRSDFPALYGALQNTWGSRDGSSVFNLPDLRGMFLRGVETRSPEDGGRDPDHSKRTVNRPGGSFTYVGSVQEDAFQGHRHDLYIGSWGISTANFDNNWLVFANNLSNRGANYVREPASDGVHGQPRISSETRPLNAYVNYIIKY